MRDAVKIITDSLRLTCTEKVWESLIQLLFQKNPFGYCMENTWEGRQGLRRLLKENQWDIPCHELGRRLKNAKK